MLFTDRQIDEITGFPAENLRKLVETGAFASDVGGSGNVRQWGEIQARQLSMIATFATGGVPLKMSATVTRLLFATGFPDLTAPTTRAEDVGEKTVYLVNDEMIFYSQWAVDEPRKAVLPLACWIRSRNELHVEDFTPQRLIEAGLRDLERLPIRFVHGGEEIDRESHYASLEALFGATTINPRFVAEEPAVTVFNVGRYVKQAMEKIEAIKGGEDND